MTSRTPQDRLRRLLRCAGRTGTGLALASLAGGLGACNVDSYMDPSITGRWEYTPTTVPILDRLASIEDQPIELVEKSPIQQSDLLPEIEEYRFAPADQLQVQIRDFFFVGQIEEFPVVVDLRGYIELPKLRPIRAQGMTKGQLTARIEQEIRDAQINSNPVVNVIAGSQRKQTFSILGAVQAPGTYFIPAADYRLLEALPVAQGIDENIKHLYVIRQVPLTDVAAGRSPDQPQPERPRNPFEDGRNSAEPKPDGGNLINLIDQLAGPEGQGTPKPAPEPAPAPGAAPDAPIDLIPSDAAPGAPTPAPTPAAEPAPKRAEPQPLDLPSSSGLPARSALPAGPGAAPGSDFVFQDGRWVRKSGMTPAEAAEPVLTQRVIEVPLDRLLAGVADVNIVIRPGDIIHVPPNRGGLVYITGQVSRPGPFNLPTDGSRLTLLRALDSAGGLSSIAIPERIDLTRMVGKDRQATIRINGRAIAEQTQPDIYLKPEDRINVGTNFWALPLAVVRGGLRASYGFGFILDRNFGNDLFGAPPADNGR